MQSLRFGLCRTTSLYIPKGTSFASQIEALRGKGFGLVRRFSMRCETQGFLSLSRLMPTAPSSEGAKGGRRIGYDAPLCAPSRGAGTALAVTEGSPVGRKCQFGKEKAEYRKTPSFPLKGLGGKSMNRGMPPSRDQ